MNWFLIIGVAVAILLFVYFNQKDKKGGTEQGAAAAASTVTQTATGPPLTVLGNSGAVSTPTVSANASGAVTPKTIGTPGAGTTLTGSQCRATCRGKCGRRPLIAITKAQKSRKACHANCKASICSWIGDGDYGYDE